MQTIALSDYIIYVGPIETGWQEFLTKKKYTQILVIADENTQTHCLPLLTKALNGQAFDLIHIPAGEQHKHIGTCQQIWQQMLNVGLDRQALVINLGGGVIGDMGGFCASTYKRGVDFVQVPTTLLSQVDASIGGKLGIDFGMVKNSIGVFCNPKAVFIDPAFLTTLSTRELRSGFAEIIKHGLIQDAAQWATIKGIGQLDSVDWPKLIVPSLLIKKHVVEVDPFERGLRKALNFGHTIGHAVESFALDLEGIKAFFIQIYGHEVLEEANFAAYLHLMGNDKKNEGKKINFSLIGAPGEVHINCSADADAIFASLRYYQHLAG
jgi:3-dehydroquinate synthase